MASNRNTVNMPQHLMLHVAVENDAAPCLGIAASLPFGLRFSENRGGVEWTSN
jgi:hypothetical protein